MGSLAKRRLRASRARRSLKVSRFSGRPPPFTGLVELAYDFGADFSPAGMSKDELVDGLARLRRTKLEDLLPELSRDELKAACEWRELDSSGREKQVLIDRLLCSERNLVALGLKG